MKHILLLLVFLFAAAGCGREYHGREYPHIVSIDPPQEEIDPDLMAEPFPPRVIKLNREELQTVTVTFSSRPQNLVVSHRVEDYVLQDTTLTIDLYCYIKPQIGYARDKIHGVEHLYLGWDGGAAHLHIWCPEEKFQ